MKNIFIRYGRLAVAGAAALGTLAGCGDREPETTTVVTAAPPATTTTVTTPAGSATTTTTPGTLTRTPPTNDTNAGAGGPTGTETEIADAINKRIHTNTQMTGSRVTAVVDASGTATLTGFTQNRQQKALAEKAARDTVGVVEVRNKLEIRPTGGVGKTPKTPPPATTKVIVVPGPPTTPPPAPKTARPDAGTDDAVIAEPVGGSTEEGGAGTRTRATDEETTTTTEETAPRGTGR